MLAKHTCEASAKQAIRAKIAWFASLAIPSLARVQSKFRPLGAKQAPSKFGVQIKPFYGWPLVFLGTRAKQVPSKCQGTNSTFASAGNYIERANVSIPGNLLSFYLMLEVG